MAWAKRGAELGAGEILLTSMDADGTREGYDLDLTRAVSLGADLRWQDGQYLVGDSSNQEPKLPGFATVSLHAVYRAGPGLELFGEVQNLFDRRYYTYGAFAQLGGLPPSVSLSDPRTYSPAEGRSITVGARLRFD